MAEKEKQKSISVNFPNELKGGVYSNFMIVSHTKEEFVLDFIMIAASAGSVTLPRYHQPGPHEKNDLRPSVEHEQL